MRKRLLCIVAVLFVADTAVGLTYSQTYTPWVISLNAGREIKQINCIRNSSGSIQSNARHAVQLDFVNNTPGWVQPHVHTHSLGHFYTIRYQPGYALRNPDAPLTGTWKQDTPTSPWYYRDSQGTDYYSDAFYQESVSNESEMDEAVVDTIRGGTSWYRLVASPTAEAITGNGASVISHALSQGGASQPCLAYHPTGNETYYLHLASPANTALQTGGFRLIKVERKNWWVLKGYKNNGSPTNNPPLMPHTIYFWKAYQTETFAPIDYTITKLPCLDASIDGRRMYGQPDSSGRSLLDPNQPLRPINFGSWTYMGGLFVGNMPVEPNGDRSRTARIQLWPTGGTFTGSSKLVFLSMLLTGNASAASQSTEVIASTAASNDPFASETEMTATWSKAWANAGSGTKAALSTSTPVNEYYNLSLPLDASSAQRLIVSLYNENPSVKTWWYFASREHEARSTVFPHTDSRPRVWLIDEVVGQW